MNTHLIDGTYELFRHFFGAPPHVNKAGREVAATRGVLFSVLGLMEEGATHVGVATDHVIESFRNGMWPGYKTSAGVDPLLLGQFGLLEDTLEAMGVVVWPMVEVEADDALASAAAVASAAPSVTQVIICTPDKDLGQCVSGTRVVQLDRRKSLVIDEDGVRPSSGSRRPRSRTTSVWWATAPTGFPAWPDGGRRAPLPCWHATATSRPSLTRWGSGRCR